MTTLDDRLRARLAEIRAAAGVPHAQLSLDVLYFLPKGFLDQYADMFTRAVKADGGEDARARAQQAGGDLEKARGTGAKPAKRYKKAFVVQDEKALNLKSQVDKRLRHIARDIEMVLSGGEIDRANSRCPSCGTFIQSRWKYCPMDGHSLGS